MEPITNMARVGTESVVDLADQTTKAAIVAVRETKNLMESGASSAIKVAGTSVDTALTEVERLQAQFMDSVRKILEAVLAAQPRG